jgi:hypothetical protein
MKYKKEIMEWMNGAPIQWRSKNYHDKWEDLPKVDSDTVESFTVSKKGLTFVQCGHFSLDFLNDNSMEFRIKPEEIILRYRIALIKKLNSNCNYKLKVIYNEFIISNNSMSPKMLKEYVNIELNENYEFVGWVDNEVQQLDVNLF